MTYEIVYSTQRKEFQLEEYFGSLPVEYKCTVSMCWKDCVPCCYCEHSEMVILDQKKYDSIKEKTRNRKIIPCSRDHSEYFSHHRLHTQNFNENYFGIRDGVAYPIQSALAGFPIQLDTKQKCKCHG